VFAEPASTGARIATLHPGDKVKGEMVTNPDTDEEWMRFDLDGETVHVSTIHLWRLHPDNIVDGDFPIDGGVANRYWGMPWDYEPSDLVEIPDRWKGRDGREMLLRREACESLSEMFEAAAAEGLNLAAYSPYRSGERQYRIYSGRIQRNPAQRSSSRPGHSEHQLGTTVDLGDAEGTEVLSQGFENTPHYRWLSENAAKYGWSQSYTRENEDETGYICEPWHWRYRGRPAN
jgi:LAS superfamily LD-carboxypeptidase LdcB